MSLYSNSLQKAVTRVPTNHCFRCQAQQTRLSGFSLGKNEGKRKKKAKKERLPKMERAQPASKLIKFNCGLLNLTVTAVIQVSRGEAPAMP
jgi:hypothetical protein